MTILKAGAMSVSLNCMCVVSFFRGSCSGEIYNKIRADQLGSVLLQGQNMCPFSL